MIFLLALVVGVLFASGTYMMMRRSIVRILLGLTLLGNAANLMIFVMGGLKRGRPPILNVGQKNFSQTPADPIPQALILTAIVISFAVIAFALALASRTYEESGLDRVDELRGSDE